MIGQGEWNGNLLFFIDAGREYFNAILFLKSNLGNILILVSLSLTVLLVLYFTVFLCILSKLKGRCDLIAVLVGMTARAMAKLWTDPRHCRGLTKLEQRQGLC
jgi:hypothetical protein